MLMRNLFAVVLMGLLLTAQPARAALNVLACEPEWAALVTEVAGDRAKVSSATTARQDPHHIEARPSLIARTRNADLVVCSGADLEVGWLPLLLRESGNPRVQAGQPGHFEATRHLRLLEKPARVDRSMGDVHAAGNPHVHLDPRNLLLVSEALARRLAELDPAGAADYAARRAAFASRMQTAIARWEKEAASLRGLPVVVQHRSWTYLADWLGLRVVADLEPKPGVEPSAAHLARLLETLKAQPARGILRAAYLSPRAGDWLAEKAGVPALTLPYSVGDSPASADLFGLFDSLVAQLKAGLQ
ncbi:MAG: zinc ABC transporter substrate-binding protein [Pseudomonadota bacterium]